MSDRKGDFAAHAEAGIALETRLSGGAVTGLTSPRAT